MANGKLALTKGRVNAFRGRGNGRSGGFVTATGGHVDAVTRDHVVVPGVLVASGASVRCDRRG
jgi:hypothetical protein